MKSDSLNYSSTSEGASNMLPPSTGSSHINVGAAERIASAVAGGALLAFGIKDFLSPKGIASAIAGGLLLQRGITGYCMVNNAIGRNTNMTDRRSSAAIDIQQVFQIEKPVSEVYAFWRRLENLPLFMKHLKKVEEFDTKHSTWTAHVPGHVGTVSWKAMIDQDTPEELIAWSSLPGSTIDNAGEIRFSNSGGGTELRVRMSYRLPAGELGSLAAKLISPAVERMINEDLKRFKDMIEGGEFSYLTSGSELGSTAFSGSSTYAERTNIPSGEATGSRKGKGRKKPQEQSSQFPDPDATRTYEDNFMERD